MSDNNHIDDIFRSGLEGFEMTPSEKSWNSLEADLSKKRAVIRRKKIFRLFSVSLLLLLIGFTAYKFYASKNTSVQKKENNIELNVHQSRTLTNAVVTTNNTGSKIENAAPVNEIKKPEVKSNPVTASLKTYPAKKQNSVAISTEKIDSAPLKLKSKPVISSAKNDKVSQIPVSTSVKSTKATEDKIAPVVETVMTSDVKKSALAEMHDAAINHPSEESSLTSHPDNITQPTNPTVDNSGAALKNNAVQKSGETIVPEIKNEPVNPVNNLNETSEVKHAVAPISKPEEGNTLLKNEPAVAANNPKTSPEINPAIAAENKNDSSKSLAKRILSHVAAEVYYSPDFVSNRLKVNPDYTGTASKNLNDYNDQKSDFSYSAGANLRYHMGSNWSIASGVSYSTFIQSAVYNTIQVVADSVYHEEHGEDHHHGPGDHHHQPPNSNNDHHYVVQTPCGAIDLHNEPPHGQFNPQNGDTISMKTETHESIHFIYIPLTIRYQFGKHKISYFIDGGAALNIVNYDQVKVVVNDSYTENNNIDGLRTMNYSLLIGAGVQYNFYKGLSMFVRPSFRYSISPINQSNPVSSYPDVFGIGTGFSIHF